MLTRRRPWTAGTGPGTWTTAPGTPTLAAWRNAAPPLTDHDFDDPTNETGERQPRSPELGGGAGRDWDGRDRLDATVIEIKGPCGRTAIETALRP